MKNDFESNECIICFSSYDDEDKVVILKCDGKYSHHFHEVCIKDWLKINGTCPICRYNLIDN